MRFLSKKNSFYCPVFEGQSNGYTLPVVLFFSVVIVISASVYLYSQFSLLRPVSERHASFQALLTARSGVWYIIDSLRWGISYSDTQITINTLDSNYFQDSFPSSSHFVFFEPQQIQPFNIDSFGFCEVNQYFKGCFKVVASTGKFRTKTRNVKVIVGSALNLGSDTVLYLENSGEPQGEGRIDGKVCFLRSDALGESNKILQVAKKEFQIRPSELMLIEHYYQMVLYGYNDSAVFETPRTIQSNIEFNNIPDRVNGHLLIDGSFSDLYWNSNRRVIVLGDLQFSGTTLIENAEFIVGGQIKIYDKSELRNVSLFSAKKIWIQDKSIFNGIAVAREHIFVAGDAQVLNSSMLVALGCPGEKKTIERQEIEKQIPFSIFIQQSAVVDAVVVAAMKPGGVKIGSDAKVSGIVWTQGPVCLSGELRGIIRANSLIPEKLEKGQAPQGNFFKGTIKPLTSLRNYFLPVFLGEPRIIEWREQ